MLQIFLSSSVAAIMLSVLFIIISPKLEYHHKNYPTEVHRTIYVDRNLDNWRLEEIISAAIEWHEATKGLVTFDVEKLPQDNIDPNNSLIMIEITPDFPEIIIMENKNHNLILGFYNNENGWPYIALVTSRLDENDFKSVVLHELGHSLGLEHNKGVNGIGSLMYPSIEGAATHITNRDLDNFCKLYKCDSKKLYH